MTTMKTWSLPSMVLPICLTETLDRPIAEAHSCATVASIQGDGLLLGAMTKRARSSSLMAGLMLPGACVAVVFA